MINEYGNYIDESKIALMGYSAGGHLALLYAYAGSDILEVNAHPIKVVISEAGPTYFTQDNINNDIAKMMGYETADVAHSSSNLNNTITVVSPVTYVSANSPKTILAYSDSAYYIDGNNQQHYVTGSDGLIPFNSAEKIVGKIINGYEDGYTMTNEKFETDNVSAYKFSNIGHNDMILTYSEISDNWRTDPDNLLEYFFCRIYTYLENN